MNEVRMSTVVSPLAARPASSKGGNAEAAVQEVGKILPPAAAESDAESQAALPPPAEASADSAEQVRNAVASISDYVQSIDRDLQFTVDEELDRTVVKVIDSQTGELIRQIPEEVFLELARKLKDDGEFQLIDAVG